MSLIVGGKVGKMFKGYGFWQGEVIEMTETHASVAWAWPQPEEPTMERITSLEIQVMRRRRQATLAAFIRMTC